MEHNSLEEKLCAIKQELLIKDERINSQDNSIQLLTESKKQLSGKLLDTEQKLSNMLSTHQELQRENDIFSQLLEENKLNVASLKKYVSNQIITCRKDMSDLSMNEILTSFDSEHNSDLKDSLLALTELKQLENNNLKDTILTREKEISELQQTIQQLNIVIENSSSATQSSVIDKRELDHLRESLDSKESILSKQTALIEELNSKMKSQKVKALNKIKEEKINLRKADET